MGLRRHLLMLIAGLMMAVATPLCRAQDDAAELDPAMLIERLAEEGMSELLLHLVETEKPDDPVLAKQIEIAGLKIEYQRLLRDSVGYSQSDPQHAEALRELAREAYGSMTDAMRALIRDHADHDQRPIWQTDLAQSLILDKLHGMHQSAPLFTDFGITTPEQDAALAQTAPEAYALLADAQLRLFFMRGEVGRDEARSRQLQASGLFFRLFDEYDKKRTPYYLAYAAYLVAQLPDEADYFASPDAPDAVNIPQREADPKRERSRLLLQADGELKKVLNRPTDGLGTRDAVTALRSRVLLARGRYDEAIDLVDELLQGREQGPNWVTAKLTRIAALYQRGTLSRALPELRALGESPAVQGDLRYSLLVTDMTHKIMLAEAKLLPEAKQPAGVAASYEPYLALLSGPITGAQSQGLRDFIYRRWEATLDADTGQALPPIVRLAISQVLRQQAQAILDQLEQSGVGSTAERLEQRSKAKDKFDRAALLALSLLDKQVDVEPGIRAEAMFNLALAMHGSNPSDTANRLKLTTILTDLADQMPDQLVAEDAITASVALLRELHQVLPTPVGVEKAYERAAGVLFSKFPTSEAADGERLYFGYAVYAQTGRYREAVDMYRRVPFDHDDYFRAQRQALLSLHMLWESSAPSARPRLRREIDSLMKTLGTEAGRLTDSQINPERAETARRAEATVRLIRAELALDEKDTDAVIQAVEGFELAYPKQADLIGMALELRLVALGDAGRREALAQTAERMVRDYPDQAAPVIDQVLTKAETRIDQLHVEAATASTARREQIEQEARGQAQMAAVLAKYLLDWAKTQDFDAQTLMPFEVIRAKTLRMSGDVDTALPILSGLIRDYPNDAQVMAEYAHVLYAKGDEDSLIEAVRYYDRLITGLSAPYPPEWWTAWMRRLQINDQLGEGTEEIPLRVRQLRMTHPDLGGPVTKMELERLEQKHRN